MTDVSPLQRLQFVIPISDEIQNELSQAEAESTVKITIAKIERITRILKIGIAILAGIIAVQLALHRQ
ncbi:MAG: hypothetical protein K1060chlam1_01036 [Candidatus Anoxychlamydiales bacterium]|nr:hypothetical protein [Candidatus Anoxychlamydiales bacterium]